MQATAKGKRWRILHSLWIAWTLPFGFLSWLAFAYIGLRARHSRWVLCALVYATPLILFAVLGGGPNSWQTNLTLTATLLLWPVSVIHAFLARKEYLLRLEMLHRETSNVSVTSSGRRWEILHSLWIGWTFTFGFFSWLAFVYIGIRARRPRWIAWGIAYFAAFVSFAASSTIAGPESGIAESATGLMFVSGVVSVIHAFLVREDYLVSLENRTRDTAMVDSDERPAPEPGHILRHGDAFAEERIRRKTSGTKESPPTAASTDRKGSDAPEQAGSPAPTAPALAPVQPKAGAAPKDDGSSPTGDIAESYPLPTAYTWSLLASLWDPRDRYREQLRHAENLLAFLGSVSLALLDEQGDLEKAEIDLRLAWQGGISFGAWKLLIQRSAKVFRTYEGHPLASDICRLKIGSENKGFGADVAALISARNDYHHGRGPVTDDEMVAASNEAQERLQGCMEALSFLTRYPIRLIQDFDVDRRGGQFSLKCLRLAGDGPGFMQERVDFPRALPRGDLYLDLGQQNWVSLHPFVVASNCPSCRYRETYFIEQWSRGKGLIVMKSFERGHGEQRRDVSESLADMAGERHG